MEDYNPEFLTQILDACGEIELTAEEERFLKWLAGWDRHTTRNITAIIRKARQAERERTTREG